MTARRCFHWRGEMKQIAEWRRIMQLENTLSLKQDKDEIVSHEPGA